MLFFVQEEVLDWSIAEPVYSRMRQDTDLGVANYWIKYYSCFSPK